MNETRMDSGGGGSGNAEEIYPPTQEEMQKYVDTMTVNMPPPSQVHHTQILAVAGLYFFLFLIGLCGNTGVLTIVFHLHRSLKQTKVGQENTFIYLIALSIVDSCVILSLPVAISDMLLGHWIFGSIICKVYWTLESTGKIMSTFILTAMSFDRYIGVCHPTKSSLRSRRSSLMILILLVLLSLALLSPLSYHATSRIIKQSNPIPDGQGRFVRFTTKKCRVFSMQEVTFVAFTWYIFVVGHIIPAMLIFYFYFGMLWEIRKHRRKSMTNSRIPIKRIILYTLAICGFYFACWTPYWAGNILYVQFNKQGTTDNFVYFMYVVHALPFVNSAFNWIFYALLNTQLRRTQQQVNNPQWSRVVSGMHQQGGQDSTMTRTGCNGVIGASKSTTLMLNNNNSNHNITTTTRNHLESGEGGVRRGISNEQQQPHLHHHSPTTIKSQTSVSFRESGSRNDEVNNSSSDGGSCAAAGGGGENRLSCSSRPSDGGGSAEQLPLINPHNQPQPQQQQQQQQLQQNNSPPSTSSIMQTPFNTKIVISSSIVTSSSTSSSSAARDNNDDARLPFTQL